MQESTHSGQVTGADDKKTERQQERMPEEVGPYPSGQVRFKRRAISYFRLRDPLILWELVLQYSASKTQCAYGPLGPLDILKMQILIQEVQGKA